MIIKAFIIAFLFLVTGVKSYPQQSNDYFNENAFLIGKYSKIKVYKDCCKDSNFSIIENNFDNDKFFKFQIVSQFKNRLQIKYVFTIDGGNDSKDIKCGWICLGSIGVYITTGRDPQLALHNSKLKFIRSVAIKSVNLFKATPIKNIKFDSSGHLWVQVKLHSSSEAILGWIKPENQCTDIWNACRGN